MQKVEWMFAAHRINKFSTTHNIENCADEIYSLIPGEEKTRCSNLYVQDVWSRPQTRIIATAGVMLKANKKFRRRGKKIYEFAHSKIYKPPWIYFTFCSIS